MIDIHDRVHAFADGELSLEEASAFREHLANCHRCQSELHDVLQLEALGDRLPRGSQPQIVPAAAPSRRPQWHRRPAVWALSSGIAAAAICFAVYRQSGMFFTDPLLAETTSRPFEARLSDPRVSAYHPYDVARGGSSRLAEQIPLRALAKLEDRRDFHGVAAGHLLRGEAEQAGKYLEKEPPTPSVKCDLAVVRLLQSHPEEALILLDEVLEAAPAHPQALWNKGLALQDLGLPLSAAHYFARVADLLEPGWSQEARQRATSLELPSKTMREASEASRKAGMALAVEGTPFPADLIQKSPATAMIYFYNAARSAPTRERLERLAPLAAQLDRINSDDRLTRYLRRIAARDFRKRGPLAETYASLLTRRFDSRLADDYLKRLEAAGEHDILAGALSLLDRTRSELPRLEKEASQSDEVWLTLFADHERARLELEQGDVSSAELRLLHGMDYCHQLKQPYRCAQFEASLAELYTVEHQLAQARQHAARLLEIARALNNWDLHCRFTQLMANISRFHRAPALARAYLLEVRLQKPGDCRTEKFVQELLATVYIQQLQSAQARKEIEAAPDCGEPFSLTTPFVLADMARMDGRAEDADRAERILDVIRKAGKLRPDQLLYADHVQARVIIERNPTEGRAALRSVISRAEAFPRPNATIAKARAYSYASLILDAGKAGEYDKALSLFAEEVRAPPPAACSLGIELQDERILVVAQGSNGQVAGAYRTDRKSPSFEVSSLVPGNLVSQVRSCPAVNVYARTPVHGRAGLLPPDIAWSYHRGATTVTPRPPADRRLLIADVMPPGSLQLPRLNPWRGESGKQDLELKGTAATPSRVISKMPQAGEIEFHAHGLVNLGVSDASFLALSPDSDGKYAFTAADIRGTRLNLAPIVILGACRTAQAAPYLHEPWGLPLAFIEAGARAVIASPFDIPDLEATEFLAAVRTRIEAGTPPSAAVRDERVAYLKKDAGSWATRIVVFD